MIVVAVIMLLAMSPGGGTCCEHWDAQGAKLGLGVELELDRVRRRDMEDESDRSSKEDECEVERRVGTSVLVRGACSAHIALSISMHTSPVSATEEAFILPPAGLKALQATLKDSNVSCGHVPHCVQLRTWATLTPCRRNCTRNEATVAKPTYPPVST